MGNSKLLLFRNFGSWALALFFIVGGSINFLATDQIRSDYVHWGYPIWFHYVTAILEFCVAFLLARRETRLLGSVLGAFVMFAAAATVLRSGDPIHALLPLIVLSLVAVNAWFNLRES
ncbi:MULTISPECIES: DoxX family protein [Rhizobium/Agrobacterium group]|uniref:DoxX family protein n=1 Tax=Rhizobium/Agrobacterium group TaxID=227290 RepID=UPI001ADCC1C3|nr:MULTISPECIES: DoxX family protein [Rhizobium/Agrobacterium group]MBO9112722.1 DoxX family protein [Agrobacterium sp. S2/73]QXZ76208.1 DoxX family protein [Agrobacterium sp. S7/73]QYA17243.1 DoxX family protein [Rhizobium sp. AB2/73]UEQ85640.1 DoxX family protein [Rhizobium sp. AB2/73]